MKQFPCEQCGADLKFSPSEQSLQCPYCGHLNAIPQTTENSIIEHDFYAFVRHESTGQSAVQMDEVLTVKCTTCASETTLNPNITADECPFCGTSLVKTTQSQKRIKPAGLLPFKIQQKEAQTLFRDWLGSLWFAPSKLQAFARDDHGLKGIYIPHWTFDTQTTTSYSGERGDAYWESVSYTDHEGKRQSRQERRIRWSHRAGTVFNAFDDVIIPASRSLPEAPLHELEPWDLPQIVPYQDAYLSGFRAESYQVSLETGFEEAKEKIWHSIETTIRQDIGGDEQRIHQTNVQHQNVTFKHILLPIWVSAYQFQGKVFRVLVNARTGEIQGERPWSWIKITFAILLAIALIIILVLVFDQSSY